MKLDTRILAAVVVAVLLGFWLGSSPASPVNPNPPRPILRAFAGVIRTAARLGLWVAIAAEKPPTQDRHQMVKATFDADGHPVVDHGEGW